MFSRTSILSFFFSIASIGGSDARVQTSVISDEVTQSPYSIVIDGGSTGSRLHIFQFVEEEEDGSEGTRFTCQREGSMRANVPLSTFAPAENEVLNASAVAAHMLPPFEFAASIIPAEFYNTTVVKYQATAGMRLLTNRQQVAVYDALYQGLMESESFVFKGMKREDVHTLSGDLEGYYGAVAANYLSGVIDANLNLISKHGERKNRDEENGLGTHPIGALDMGGSSTQIVYLTEQIDNGSHNCPMPPADNASDMGTPVDNVAQDEEDFPKTCHNYDYDAKPTRLQGENFFSESYLSYGVDQFRERLWNTMIVDRQMDDHSDSCDTRILEYPCGFKEHQLQWRGYTFVGTGDASECIRQVRRLLPHPEETIDNHHEYSGRTVGGIDHPPVRGKFFAMSLYFFTLDSLRVLSRPKADAHEALNSAWPRPSIEELADALEGLCSRSWKGDLEEIQHNAHQFTRAEVLPHRCFESVYMVTLLRDGFGFHPQSRDITFTFLVDGSEAEWSLGMAIAMFSESRLSGDPVVSSVRCLQSAEDRNATEEVKQESAGQKMVSPFVSVLPTSGQS